MREVLKTAAEQHLITNPTAAGQYIPLTSTYHSERCR